MAELLVTFGRRRDALELYRLFADEPEGQKAVGLQQRTARLANELGEAAAVKVACERLAGLEPGARCP